MLLSRNEAEKQREGLFGSYGQAARVTTASALVVVVSNVGLVAGEVVSTGRVRVDVERAVAWEVRVDGDLHA